MRPWATIWGADISLIICPLKLTEPEVGLSSPEIVLRRVDFPWPLGPMIDTREPDSTSNETSLRTSRLA